MFTGHPTSKIIRMLGILTPGPTWVEMSFTCMKMVKRVGDIVLLGGRGLPHSQVLFGCWCFHSVWLWLFCFLKIIWIIGTYYLQFHIVSFWVVTPVSRRYQSFCHIKNSATVFFLSWNLFSTLWLKYVSFALCFCAV